MIQPIEYVIEDLFPKGQVHLIGGPSGGGKTTLMFQMYEALTTGADFLGRRTAKVKWAYISGDRTARSVQETQLRLGVEFPIFSLVDHNLIGESLVVKVIPRLTHLYGYRPDFIYIDGFTACVPGGKSLNDYGSVSKFLGELQRYCFNKEITILGACHTSKTKEGERLLNPRQRIAGSVAWAGFSDSVIIIEPPDHARDDGQRVCSLLPRNHPGEEIYLHFDNSTGRLVIGGDNKNFGAQALAAADFILPSLMEADPNGILHSQTMWHIALEKGFSRRTFERWLARMVEDKKVFRIEKGQYRFCVVQPDQQVTLN